jgi:nicotinamidase-related amidase
MKIHLICIDDQNDFVDPTGSLFVPGGGQNVKRLAKMIDRLSLKLDDITLTMDSHTKLDISHPMWWVDDHGNSPPPFTCITPVDISCGKWRARILGTQKRSTQYINQLAATGRYPHVIWPEHCLIGTPGHNLDPDLLGAVHRWEERGLGRANYVTKGSNMWTEHFSAVKAEVPDPEDPSTQVNRQLVEDLESADLVIWGGEALSHCLANTFRDTASCFADASSIRKMVLLTDASSPVPGFQKFADDFVHDMKSLGMRLSTTTDILV